MTRKEASPGGSEDCAHQSEPLTQQGVWLWRPRGAGGEPISWVVVAAPFAVAPGDLPSSECCTIRTTLAAAQGQPDAQCYQRTWPSPGVVACSPWLPSSFCIPSLQPLHIGLTRPNLHPDALDTVPCKQGVHLEEKSAKALTFYLRLLPHSPAPFLPGCAGHRSVGPHGGAWHSRPQGAQGPWPICRRHTSSPPHTTGARQRVLGTCARAPLPSSHSSAHSSHTCSLSRTLHNSHANSCSHIHSHTHS